MGGGVSHFNLFTRKVFHMNLSRLNTICRYATSVPTLTITTDNSIRGCILKLGRCILYMAYDLRGSP